MTATFNSNLAIDPITGFDHRRYAEFFCHPSSFARSQCFSENYADGSLQKIKLIQNLDIQHNTKEIEKFKEARITLERELEQLKDKKRKIEAGILRGEKRLLRKEIEMEARVLIQRVYIGHYCRKKLREAKEDYGAKCMQKIIRTFLVRRRIKHMTDSAIQIQRIMRGKLVRLHKEERIEAYLHRMRCLVKIQSLVRGFLGRRRVYYKRKNMNEAALTIQHAWRNIIETVDAAGDTFITQFEIDSPQNRKLSKHNSFLKKISSRRSLLRDSDSMKDTISSHTSPTSVKKTKKKKAKPIILFPNPNGRKNSPMTRKQILDASQKPLTSTCYADYLSQTDEDASKLCKIYSDTAKHVGDEAPEIETYGEYMEEWTAEEKERILREQLELRLWQEKQMDKQVSAEMERKRQAKERFKKRQEEMRKEVIKKGKKKIEEQRKIAKQNKITEKNLTAQYKETIRSKNTEDVEKKREELDEWKEKKKIEKKVMEEFKKEKMRKQTEESARRAQEAEERLKKLQKEQKLARKLKKEKEEKEFLEEMERMEEKERKRREAAVIGYDLARLRVLKQKRDELMKLKKEVNKMEEKPIQVQQQQQQQQQQNKQNDNKNKNNKKVNNNNKSNKNKDNSKPPLPPSSGNSKQMIIDDTHYDSNANYNDSVNEDGSSCYCDSYDTESLLSDDLSIDDRERLELLKMKEKELIERRNELLRLEEEDEEYFNEKVKENEESMKEEELKKQLEEARKETEEKEKEREREEQNDEQEDSMTDEQKLEELMKQRELLLTQKQQIQQQDNNNYNYSYDSSCDEEGEESYDFGADATTADEVAVEDESMDVDEEEEEQQQQFQQKSDKPVDESIHMVNESMPSINNTESHVISESEGAQSSINEEQ